MAEFVRVARTKEIPSGEGRMFAVNGRQVAVFNVGGRFHAIDHRCAHQQGPLAEGDLEDCVVTCPWHGWTYDVTTGQSPDDADARVARYDTRVEKGELLIAVPTPEG
ncbi:MAG TPA: Rieske 2Fe-2S domain-containing protein [Candidatus Dormibacteraeota bacterium]|nr:Rieske 2Fe-2S domain-containing protein [Candidatus Dormibacteraeota bacterium]